MTNLSKNFTVKEMACPLTGECVLQRGWIEILQELRDHCGFPFVVAKGKGGACRTRTFNKSIKGAPNSFHLIDNPLYKTDTCAIDIATNNYPKEMRNERRGKIIAHAKAMGLSVIVYPAHIHVDARTRFAGLPVFHSTGIYKK
jgi:hypothetical protein